MHTIQTFPPVNIEALGGFKLEAQLRMAVDEQDIGVAPELTAAEFIAFNLGEVLEDLEPIPGTVNPGGQMTLPV
jgi:hypothetical protein